MSSSYRQIFKSSALFGGTQVLNILIGIIRTKFLAVLLGPSGVGIAGMYQSSTGVIGTIAGVGVNRAGIRQIAEAFGTGDEEKIALTVKTLRFVSLVSGVLGMLVVFCFCKPLSSITFGNQEYVWGTAVVSLVLFFNGISAGQTALLQGMRRLKDLAICQVAGALFGSVASIAIIYLWGVPAVAWYLVAIAAFNILPSWWYARKVRVVKSRTSTDSMIVEARGLLKMGSAFMVSGLVTTGTVYFSRILVIRELGLDAVGLYTAVITLSSIYVNVILQAMSADYYPRMAAIASDHEQVNRMVNEQTEIGFVLAVPGILVTLTMAPWILEICYSAEFISAANVIQWQIIGIGLCVISWPIGIIMPALGLKRYLVGSEVVAAAVRLVSLVVGMKLWGFEGVGIASLLTYICHILMVFFIAKKSTGFRWSKNSVLIMTSSFTIIGAVFLLIRLLPKFWGMVWGVSITAATTVGCFWVLSKMLNFTFFKFRKADV